MAVALILSAALAAAGLGLYSFLRRLAEPKPVPVRVRDDADQRRR